MNNLFYRKIYVFSKKQFIVPVKINIIFILLDVLENLSICNLQHHTWTFLPNIKFILNKNGDTKKNVSVTQWKRWKQIWYWFNTHFCEIFGKQYYMSRRGSRNFSKGVVEEKKRYDSVHTHKLNKRSTLSLFLPLPFHFFCFLLCTLQFFKNKNILIEFTLYFVNKRELYRSRSELKYSWCSLHHRRSTYQNTGLRDLRDGCDGNIKMKLNDEHAYALIVDLRICILHVCLLVALWIPFYKFITLLLGQL